MPQEETKPLSSLKQGDRALVASLDGGCGFQRRLRSMGLLIK